jgi:hypothetical protein
VAENISQVTNMNTIRLNDMETFFRKQISFMSDKGKLQESLTKNIDKFASALSTIENHPAGKKLISLENEFNYRFEACMKPIDRALNIYIDDISYDFDEVNLTFSEALMEDEIYAAGHNLLPRDPDSIEKDPFYQNISHCEGKSCGQVWPPKDIPPLMKHLSCATVARDLSTLEIETPCSDLLKINRLLEEFVEENSMELELTELRIKRARVALGYPMILMDVYPELEYRDPRRDIDPRDIMHPILETQSEMRTMEEFSFNDFSHDSFYLLAKQIVGQIDELENQGKINEHLVDDFALYESLYKQLSSHEKWGEYQDSETIWFNEVERFLLSIKFSVESFDCDYPERWEKHKESDRYQSAVKLWELLPHNPFESFIMISRGNFINQSQWETMKIEYEGVAEQLMLKDIFADKIFKKSLDADYSSLQTISAMSENGKELHHKFRTARKRLTAVLNYLN